MDATAKGQRQDNFKLLSKLSTVRVSTHWPVAPQWLYRHQMNPDSGIPKEVGQASVGLPFFKLDLNVPTTL